MKIQAFIQTLSDVITKRDLLEQLRTTNAELRETTIPLYEAMLTDFAGWQFTSPEVKRMQPTFNTLVKKRKGNLIASVLHILKNTAEISDKLLPILDKQFEEKTAASALTYSKAQKLQLVEAIDFVTRYARKFANYVLIAETAKYDPGNSIKKRLSPKQVNDVELFFTNFCTLLNAFSGTPGDVLIVFESIPNIIVKPEDVANIEAMMGRKKIDPAGFGFINAKLSLAFHVGTWWAERQAKRYDEAKQDLEMVQLNLLNLKRKMAGEPSPALEKEIEACEIRIQNLVNDIEKMERDWLD